MNIIKIMIEFLFSCGMIINAILYIPQAIRIYKSKKVDGISLVTFIGFFLIQLTIVLHGVIVEDFFLVYGYLFSMITCGMVIVLTIIYK
ncbi:MAG TPA: PQ-loop domain-containing transporter [Burkholderiales bacterium]|nr:PQ-loop domain-containing transporter [Burkholderiales bacterium]